MGHVFGIGTLWTRSALLSGAGASEPEFTGANAMAEYATLLGESTSRAVPVVNTGGPGTAEGHWRETTFDHELLTGYVEQGEMPLSRMTIASLLDLGYQVHLPAADPYQLPSPSIVDAGLRAGPRRTCCVDFPEILEMSDDGGTAVVQPRRHGTEPPPREGAMGAGG